MSRNSRRNQNSQNGANGSDGNGGGGIVDIPGRVMGEGGGIKCNLRYDFAPHTPPPSPASS